MTPTSSTTLVLTMASSCFKKTFGRGCGRKQGENEETKKKNVKVRHSFTWRVGPRCCNSSVHQGEGRRRRRLEGFGRTLGLSRMLPSRRTTNGRGYYSAYVLFEEGLSEKIKKRLRKKGKVSLKRPLRVQRGWDYSRGDTLTEWRYDVFPCQFRHLTEEERRQRRKERREKENKTFLIDSDSDSDSDSDDDE